MGKKMKMRSKTESRNWESIFYCFYLQLLFITMSVFAKKIASIFLKDQEIENGCL